MTEGCSRIRMFVRRVCEDIGDQGGEGVGFATSVEIAGGGHGAAAKYPYTLTNPVGNLYQPEFNISRTV